MEKFFKYSSSDIAYNVIGEGQPVVLLHGFAEDKTIWDNQVNDLHKHCKLILPDLPGSGKSKMLQKENVSIEDYAAYIYALIKHEKIEKCVVLGHSMGGYITLAFAEAYPEILDGFGFIHSTAFADSEEKKNVRAKGIRLIEENGAFPFIKNTTPNLFSGNFKKLNNDVVQQLIDKGKNFAKEALIQYYNAMMKRTDKTEVLSKSNVPVLFIIGSEDTAAPLEDLLKQVHLPKLADIHILEGVGHMSMLEKPDELNTYILKFLQLVKETHEL